MNSDKQRISIAESLGISLIAYRFKMQSHGEHIPRWSPSYSTRKQADSVVNGEAAMWGTKTWPIQKHKNVRLAPNYLESLDVWHEIESKFTDKQIIVYHNHLCKIIDNNSEKDKTIISSMHWHASATQKAEAYLRTLGLWETK